MAILTETGAPRICKNIGWPSSFKPIIPLRPKSNPDFVHQAISTFITACNEYDNTAALRQY